jgi:hypothetical protein
MNKKEYESWLKGKHISFHDYDSFQDVERIDNGGFGTISRAFSKKYQRVVALKTITQNCTFRQLINEVNINIIFN